MPTLPALLEWASSETRGRLELTPALRAAAAAAEAEAAQLDAAYDTCLEFMQVHALFREVAGGSGGDSGGGSGGGGGAADAAELQRRIADAYGFIVHTAGTGGAARAADKLQRVADWMHEARVEGRIRKAWGGDPPPVPALLRQGAEGDGAGA